MPDPTPPRTEVVQVADGAHDGARFEILRDEHGRLPAEIRIRGDVPYDEHGRVIGRRLPDLDPVVESAAHADLLGTLGWDQGSTTCPDDAAALTDPKE